MPTALKPQTPAPMNGALVRTLARLTAPHVLLPLVALLILGMIWSATLRTTALETAAARRASVGTTRELLETYEAQILRALREIDQTLKMLQYIAEAEGGKAALTDLQARRMLPTSLLFAIDVVDRTGRVVAGNRPDRPSAVNHQAYFTALRDRPAAGRGLFVDAPYRDPVSHEWTLTFSRRLARADGAFAGAVTVAVDAAYFTSGYDVAKLGSHGVLGLLGTDGVFRVRRTGGAVSANDFVRYASVVAPTVDDDAAVSLVASPWDRVPRFSSARKLFEFPLAVIVGLGEQEQLAAAAADRRRSLLNAGWSSVLVVVLSGLLARMSWRLLRSQRRESAATLARAERVEYGAYHDRLSGLPNRSLFSKLLTHAIESAALTCGRVTVLVLDLDRFKPIHDTLGQHAGDRMLQEVARRLQSCVRDQDTVARLGDDEFGVLLTEPNSAQQSALRAQQILTRLAQPFLLAGQEFHVTASIGICAYPDDGEDEQTLTKHAAVALHQARAEGNNNFQCYSKALNENSLERLSLVSDLRHALERAEFRVLYQPKYDARSGSITGLEALLRWQHPDLGTIEPMRFIPVADQTGLIIPIGKWVLTTVCRQSVTWQKLGLPPMDVAVTLTSRQFKDENLLMDIAGILKESGMAAQYLELEVTESLLIRDADATLRIMTALKAMGVKIAVGDFGTCHSSLSTLRRFPLDSLKIDRSVIRTISGIAAAPEEAGAQSSAGAIIAMGRSLRLTVVARGVETAAQAGYLRAHACDQVQGFYFNRPLPAEQTTELLRVPRATPADGIALKES